MPYETVEELPDSVRDNLPAHAQKIYKEAFNSAWEQYDHSILESDRVILLGDVIFASAIRMMSEMGRDDGRVVSRAIAEISRGPSWNFPVL